jgi:hypothetical protein
MHLLVGARHVVPSFFSLVPVACPGWFGVSHDTRLPSVARNLLFPQLSRKRRCFNSATTVMAVGVAAERSCSWGVAEEGVPHFRWRAPVERTAAPRPRRRENSSEFPLSPSGVSSLSHRPSHRVQRAACAQRSSCRAAPGRPVRPLRPSTSEAAAESLPQLPQQPAPAFRLLAYFLQKQPASLAVRPPTCQPTRQSPARSRNRTGGPSHRNFRLYWYLVQQKRSGPRPPSVAAQSNQVRSGPARSGPHP